jgi:hypothetical protein
LVAAREGHDDEATQQQLARVRGELEEAGLMAYLPAVDEALAGH